MEQYLLHLSMVQVVVGGGGMDQNLPLPVLCYPTSRSFIPQMPTSSVLLSYFLFFKSHPPPPQNKINGPF